MLTAVPLSAPQRLVLIIEALIAHLEALGAEEAARPRLTLFGWSIPIPRCLVPNRLRRAAHELRTIRDAITAILANAPASNSEAPVSETQSPLPQTFPGKPRRVRAGLPAQVRTKPVLTRNSGNADTEKAEPGRRAEQPKPFASPCPPALRAFSVFPPLRVPPLRVPPLRVSHPQPPPQAKNRIPPPTFPLAQFVTIMQ